MRTMIVAAVVLVSGALTSRAEAQVAYAYGNGAYPIYYGSPAYYGAPAYYGLSAGYLAQGNYGGFTTPGFYGGTPLQNQPAPSYLGPSVQAAFGFSPNNYGYVPAGSSFSGGVARYSQYGYRRYGSGRQFGAYVPRFYSIYQPRPGGLFGR